MIEAVAPLFALFAEYLKTREDQAARIDADAFRQWLEREAFPRLLEQSEQALRSIVGLKADEKERYDILLEHVRAIRAAVVPNTAVETWRAMEPVDRAVLAAFFADFKEKPDAQFDESHLDHIKHPSDQLRKSVRYLQEKSWVIEHAFSGAWFADLTDTGVLFAWEATDPTGYAASKQRLASCLPADGETSRIGALADAAEIPYPFAQALVSAWAEQGLIEFEDGYSPPHMGLVHTVSESLRRSIMKP